VDTLKEILRVQGLSALVIALTIAVWYLSQRLLGMLLTWNGRASCPACYSSGWLVKPVQGWNYLVPFLSVYVCRNCGKQFLRGRKPPFATCPDCRSRLLEAIPPVSLAPFLDEFAHSVTRTHDYLCLWCGLKFRDSRPLHADLRQQAESVMPRPGATSTPTADEAELQERSRLRKA